MSTVEKGNNAIIAVVEGLHMQLILKPQRKKMLANGASRMKAPGSFDPLPVVKLFMNPACTWLLVSLDPRDEDIAYGLCDLGVGCPEVGSVRLSELEGLHAHSTRGYRVERDKFFVPRQSMMKCAEQAMKMGYIET